MTRTCTKCGEVKPLDADNFYRQARGRQGFSAWCKLCKRANNAKARKAWVQANPEEHKERIRRRNLKRDYGITPEDYDRLLSEQGGRCAICDGDTHRSKRGNFFHVDHDHITGEVRGLLCVWCNTALGKFQDSPEILRSAINYLEER